MSKKFILFCVAVFVASLFSMNMEAQNKGDKKIVTLRSFREKYAGIDSKDNKVYAKYGSASKPSQQFKIYELGNDQIALKGSNDKFLTYTDHNLVSAGKIAIGEREKFTVVKVTEGWFALKASNGTYLSLDPKNEDMLIVGKKTIAEWEAFYMTVIYNPEVKTEEITLNGTVVNEKTKAPVAASIQVTNALSDEVITDVKAGADGKFTAKVPSNTQIVVNARYEKFLPVGEKLILKVKNRFR
jgi:hypothetical protein